MSQAPLQVDNAAGAVVRAAINAALQALASCNSGATEPAVTYPNMFWYDTSTSTLKRRNNANDAWTDDGTADSLDTDGTLAANSDLLIASQKATKTYADTKISKSVAGEITALSEKTTLADNDVFIIEDSAAGNAKKKVKKSNLIPSSSQVGFGSWASKSPDTVYLAATDGIVVGAGQQTGGGTGTLNCKTDASNPPTTIRTFCNILNQVGTSYPYSFPVKKGDYWKVDQASHWSNDYLFFIPLGT